VKKNRLNQLEFLKNLPVRFSFISLKLKKQNRAGRKPSQTKKIKPNQTKPEPITQDKYGYCCYL
jgi:hypothetical protein